MVCKYHDCDGTGTVTARYGDDDTLESFECPCCDGSGKDCDCEE